MALVELGADLALKCGSGAVVGTPVVGTAAASPSVQPDRITKLTKFLLL